MKELISPEYPENVVWQIACWDQGMDSQKRMFGSAVCIKIRDNNNGTSRKYLLTCVSNLLRVTEDKQGKSYFDGVYGEIVCYPNGQPLRRSDHFPYTPAALTELVTSKDQIDRNSFANNVPDYKMPVGELKVEDDWVLLEISDKDRNTDADVYFQTRPAAALDSVSVLRLENLRILGFRTNGPGDNSTAFTDSPEDAPLQSFRKKTIHDTVFKHELGSKCGRGFNGAPAFEDKKLVGIHRVDPISKETSLIDFHFVRQRVEGTPPGRYSLIGQQLRSVAKPEDNPYLLGSYGEPNRDIFYGRKKEVDEIVDQLGKERVLILLGHKNAGKTSLMKAGLAPKLQEAGLVLNVSLDDSPFRKIKAALRSSEHFEDISPQSIRELPENEEFFIRLGEMLEEMPEEECYLLADTLEKYVAAEKEENTKKQKRNRFWRLLHGADPPALFLSAVAALRKSESERLKIVFALRSTFQKDAVNIFPDFNSLETYELDPTFGVNGGGNVLNSGSAFRDIIEKPAKKYLTFDDDLLAELRDKFQDLPHLKKRLADLWDRAFEIDDNLLTADDLAAVSQTDTIDEMLKWVERELDDSKPDNLIRFRELIFRSHDFHGGAGKTGDWEIIPRYVRWSVFENQNSISGFVGQLASFKMIEQIFRPGEQEPHGFEFTTPLDETGDLWTGYLLEWVEKYALVGRRRNQLTEAARELRYSVESKSQTDAQLWSTEELESFDLRAEESDASLIKEIGGFNAEETELIVRSRTRNRSRRTQKRLRRAAYAAGISAIVLLAVLVSNYTRDRATLFTEKGLARLEANDAAKAYHAFEEIDSGWWNRALLWCFDRSNKKNRELRREFARLQTIPLVRNIALESPSDVAIDHWGDGIAIAARPGSRRKEFLETESITEYLEKFLGTIWTTLSFEENAVPEEPVSSERAGLVYTTFSSRSSGSEGEVLIEGDVEWVRFSGDGNLLFAGQIENKDNGKPTVTIFRRVSNEPEEEINAKRSEVDSKKLRVDFEKLKSLPLELPADQATNTISSFLACESSALLDRLSNGSDPSENPIYFCLNFQSKEGKQSTGGTVYCMSRSDPAEIEEVLKFPDGECKAIYFHPRSDRLLSLINNASHNKESGGPLQQIRNFVCVYDVISKTRDEIAGDFPRGINGSSHPYLDFSLNPSGSLIALAQGIEFETMGDATPVSSNFASYVFALQNGRFQNGGETEEENGNLPPAVGNIPVAEKLLTVPLEHGGRTVRRVKFDPSGKFLVTGGNDNQVRVWDVRHGKYLGSLHLKGQAWQIAFTSDGRYLATGDRAKEIRLWDTSTWTQVCSPLYHDGTISNLRFGGEDTLVIASGANSVRIWNFAPWRIRPSMILEDSDMNPFPHMPVGRDSNLGLIGGSASLEQLFMRDGPEYLFFEKADKSTIQPTVQIHEPKCSIDESYLKRSIYEPDRETTISLVAPAIGSSKVVLACERWSFDGKESDNEDRNPESNRFIGVWNPNREDGLSLEFPIGNRTITRLATGKAAPTGETDSSQSNTSFRLAYVSEEDQEENGNPSLEQQVTILDYTENQAEKGDLKEVSVFTPGGEDKLSQITALDFGPDGKFLAFAAYDGDVGEPKIAWIENNATSIVTSDEKVRGENSSEKDSVDRDHKQEIRALASAKSLSGGSYFVATGGEDDRVKIWQLAAPPKATKDASSPVKEPTFTLLQSFDSSHTADIERLQFEIVDDELFLFSISLDSSVRSFRLDSSSMEPIWSEYGQYKHGSNVLDIAVSSEERLVATGGADGIVKVWSVEGELIGLLRHPGPVNRVGFSKADSGSLAVTTICSNRARDGSSRSTVRSRLDGSGTAYPQIRRWSIVRNSEPDFLMAEQLVAASSEDFADAYYSLEREKMIFKRFFESVSASDSYAAARNAHELFLHSKSEITDPDVKRRLIEAWYNAQQWNMISDHFEQVDSPEVHLASAIHAIENGNAIDAVRELAVSGPSYFKVDPKRIETGVETGSHPEHGMPYHSVLQRVASILQSTRLSGAKVPDEFDDHRRHLYNEGLLKALNQFAEGALNDNHLSDDEEVKRFLRYAWPLALDDAGLEGADPIIKYLNEACKMTPDYKMTPDHKDRDSGIINQGHYEQNTIAALYCFHALGLIDATADQPPNKSILHLLENGVIARLLNSGTIQILNDAHGDPVDGNIFVRNRAPHEQLWEHYSSGSVIPNTPPSGRPQDWLILSIAYALYSHVEMEWGAMSASGSSERNPWIGADASQNMELARWWYSQAYASYHSGFEGHGADPTSNRRFWNRLDTFILLEKATKVLSSYGEPRSITSRPVNSVLPGTTPP